MIFTFCTLWTNHIISKSLFHCHFQIWYLSQATLVKNYQHFGKIFLSECIFGTCMCVSFFVIFGHENKWQSVKWASMYKILILSSHFRLRKLRSSYQGTKNVVIYAFSSGKILDVRIFAGVKDLLRNIMSGHFVYCSWPKWLNQLS